MPNEAYFGKKEAYFDHKNLDTPNLCYKRQAIRDAGKFKEVLRDRAQPF